MRPSPQQQRTRGGGPSAGTRGGGAPPRGGGPGSPAPGFRPNRFERTKSVQIFAQDFSDEQVTIIRELFDMCDHDGDGNISASELRKVMDELGMQVGQEEFEQMFKQLDANGDQKISFGDFLSGLRWIQKSIRITSSSGAIPVRAAPSSPLPATQTGSPTSTSPGPKRHTRTKSVTEFIEETGGMSEAELAKMKKYFKECDEDGDGAIGKRELWNFLHRQGVEASKEEFLSFFDELDDDHTGTLSFKQFVAGIQGIRKGLYILRAAPSPAPAPTQQSPQSSRKATMPASPSGSSQPTPSPTNPRQRSVSSGATELQRPNSSSPSASLATSPTVQRATAAAAAASPRAQAAAPKGQTIPRPLTRQRTLVDLVQQGATQEELVQARELFELFDKNKDGSIDMEELTSMFKEMDIRATREEVASLFQKLAGNKRGITYEDFRNGMRRFNKGVGDKKEPPSDADRIAELQKNNEILRSYLQEFVGRVASKADKECKNQHHKTAAMLLELLDYPLVQQMEGFVGGKLTTAESDDSINYVNRQLAALRKK